MEGFQLKFETIVLARKRNGSDFVIKEENIVEDWKRSKIINEKTVEKVCNLLVINVIKSKTPYEVYADKMVKRGLIAHSIKFKGKFYPLSHKLLQGSWKDLIDFCIATCPYELTVSTKLIFPYKSFKLKFNVTVVAKQSDGSDFTIKHELSTDYESDIKVLEMCKILVQKVLSRSPYKDNAKEMFEEKSLHLSFKLEDTFYQLSDEILQVKVKHLVKLYNDFRSSDKSMVVFIKLIRA